eukprot:1240398-Prymnesium_polylepis.1
MAFVIVRPIREPHRTSSKDWRGKRPSDAGRDCGLVAGFLELHSPPAGCRVTAGRSRTAQAAKL